MSHCAEVPVSMYTITIIRGTNKLGKCYELNGSCPYTESSCIEALTLIIVVFGNGTCEEVVEVD